MKPSLTRFASATIAALSIVGAASAQLPVPFTQLRWDGDIDWDGSAPSGAFGRMVAGDFRRDGGRDAFLLAGTKLAFFFDPATGDEMDDDAIGSALAVNDLAAIDHSSGTGG